MRVLIMGGTRFSGLYLCKELASRGHEVFLFNRGNVLLQDNRMKVRGESQVAFQERMLRTNLIRGDRNDTDHLVSQLRSQRFDAIFDNNGRELSDSQPLIDLFEGRIRHYIYMSSAGVYRKSDTLPHLEDDPTDPQSRHKGKLDTENYLRLRDIPFTSIRPTYIYGPRNYNTVEEWFFARIDQDRPIPIPGHGQHIIGLGHVEDLARAMVSVLGNARAIGQVYNIQGRQSATFDGIARLCAMAAGKDPNKVKIIHYDPKQVNLGSRKGFPFRTQHFFCTSAKAERELNWKEEWDLLKGLEDSYENDFLVKKKQGTLELDFSVDDMILSSPKEQSVLV
eukprot:jgi/Galph1/3531/GphlegSOOS_G2240.1